LIRGEAASDGSLPQLQASAYDVIVGGPQVEVHQVLGGPPHRKQCGAADLEVKGEFMPGKPNGFRAPALRSGWLTWTEPFIAMLGLVTAIAALAIAIIAWREPRPSVPIRTLPKFVDEESGGPKEIGHNEKGRSFLQVLDRTAFALFT
jgi:hypothetical protein